MSNHFPHVSSSAVLDMLGLQSRETNSHRVMTYAGLFVAGAVVGAAAAVLLTPKSGRALRSDLREGAHKLSDQMGQGATAIADSASRQADELRHLVRDATRT